MSRSEPAAIRGTALMTRRDAPQAYGYPRPCPPHPGAATKDPPVPMRPRRLLFIVAALILLPVVALVFGAFAVLSESTEFVNEQLAFENPLAIPPLLVPRTENGEKVFDLTAQDGERAFFPGKPASTLGFNGAYLGPTIRASRGDKVRVNVTNTLGETTTVHWHGMHLPAEMDGGPHQVVEPGETWRPHWTVTNEASTLWYHPHQMGRTGEHVYRGLAGMFIIDDANSASLGLPSEYGLDDIPLVVQDRKFDADGQLVFEHDPGAVFPKAAGMLGDTILVNGTRAPYLEAPRKLIRLRILNGSDGRRYNFGFSGDHPFYQIATDGGFLESPMEMTRLLLSPGERAEVLVDLSNVEGPLTLMSYAVIDNQNVIQRFTKKMFGENDEYRQFKVLEIRPVAGDYAAGEIPQSLNRIERLDEASAVKTRHFSFQDARSINGRSMEHERIDEVVKRGDTEVWTVESQMPIYHSFHVHGVQFLLLERNGEEPPAREQGWKDTVIVNPSDTVRLILRFQDYSDPGVPYMFHCHILEHEDRGMMGQFVVVDDPNQEVRVRSPLTDAPGEEHAPH
jgi:suppressor of ftsI